jgi:hypothetical protein
MEKTTERPRVAQARKPAAAPPTKKPVKPEPEKHELSDEEKRAAQTNAFARNFQSVNNVLAERLDDEYYQVSDVDAQMWGEYASDTVEWMGVGAVPPPVNLLAFTLSIYIPKFFHYLTTRDSGEIEDEIDPENPPPEFRD